MHVLVFSLFSILLPMSSSFASQTTVSSWIGYRAVEFPKAACGLNSGENLGDLKQARDTLESELTKDLNQDDFDISIACVGEDVPDSATSSLSLQQYFEVSAVITGPQEKIEKISKDIRAKKFEGKHIQFHWTGFIAEKVYVLFYGYVFGAENRAAYLSPALFSKNFQNYREIKNFLTTELGTTSNLSNALSFVEKYSPKNLEAVSKNFSDNPKDSNVMYRVWLKKAGLDEHRRIPGETFKPLRP